MKTLMEQIKGSIESLFETLAKPKVDLVYEKA